MSCGRKTCYGSAVSCKGGGDGLGFAHRASLIDFFQNLETVRVVARLADLNDLVHSRYFLGGTALLALLALLMRWRRLLYSLLGLSGFAALLSYTLGRGTALEEGLRTDTLLIFIGGGGALLGVVIYLLFIRTD